jgi:capsular polysaccharide transport system permease protein
VIQLKNEIGALKQQIQINSEKLTSERGNALNKKTAEYETLLLRAQFAQELYSNALVTLETARVEAARQLKQVSVIQKPTLPEYALAPDRLYNIVVITILGLLVTLIMNMILLIIRDHKD